MKSKIISFGHFKYFFLALFAICLVFPSCEREGDDDDEYEEYEEDEDEDKDKNNVATLTMCLEAQLIMEVDRVGVKSLSAAEVPMAIREFIATEIPSSIIEKVETFTANTDLTYFEATVNGDIKLLFNSAEEFICRN